MDLQEALEILDRAFKENQETPLNDTERLVFEGSWNKKTYEEIALQFAEETNRYYSSNYLKQDVGPNLWNRISQVIKKTDSDSSIRVSKNKLKAATQRLKQLQEQNKDNKKTSSNRLETAVFIISSNSVNINEIVTKISDIVNEIKEASQDPSIKYREIREGSVIVVLQGSVKGFERLQTLFRNGELTEIAGFTIENIELESVTRLDVREWLENLFNLDWQPVEALVTSSVRSQANNSETLEDSISKAKTIHLGATGIVIIFQLTPLSETEIKANLKIFPTENNTYLPDGLAIEILDSSDEIALHEEVDSYTDSQEIPFIFEPEDQFKVKFILNNISVVENLFER